MDSLLLEYRERRMCGTATFKLTKGGVAVESNAIMGGSYSTVIPFNQISGDVIRIYAKDPMFWFAAWGIPTLLALELVLINSFGFSAFDSFPGFLVAAMIMCVVAAIMTFKTVEYVGFKSDVGMPLLYIAKSGPDQKRFEAFIETILETAASTRNAA